MMSGRLRLSAGAIGTTLALLLTVTPAASLAQSVSNSHGSNAVAQVVWSESYDVTTDIGRFGGIAGDIEDQGTSVSLWDADNRAITCADGHRVSRRPGATGLGPAR